MEGVFVKSEDGGATWQDASDGIVGGEQRIYGIIIAPNNPSVVYVMCQDLLERTSYYRTLNAGKTWTKLENVYSWFAMNPHDPAHLIVPSTYTETLESRDGGLTWNKVKLNIQLDPLHRIYRL